MDAIQKKIAEMSVLVDLPEGHQQRFEKKLYSRMNVKNSRMVIFYAIAASILLFFCLNITQLLNIKSAPTPNLILSHESEETIETEQYLQSEISNRISQLNSMKLKKEQVKIINNDIRDIDQSLNNLKEDLKEAPGDQRIVNAVINTYIIKLETLDNIMHLIKKYS